MKNERIKVFGIFCVRNKARQFLFHRTIKVCGRAPIRKKKPYLLGFTQKLKKISFSIWSHPQKNEPNLCPSNFQLKVKN